MSRFSRFEKCSKIRKRRARCKQVLVILNSRIETVQMIREEIHPAVTDFATEPEEFAVLRWHGLEVYVPLQSVVFLRRPPPEPKWMREARTKVEKELASGLHSKLKSTTGAKPAPTSSQRDRR